MLPNAPRPPRDDCLLAPFAIAVPRAAASAFPRVGCPKVARGVDWPRVVAVEEPRPRALLEVPVVLDALPRPRPRPGAPEKGCMVVAWAESDAGRHVYVCVVGVVEVDAWRACRAKSWKHARSSSRLCKLVTQADRRIRQPASQPPKLTLLLATLKLFNPH